MIVKYFFNIFAKRPTHLSPLILKWYDLVVEALLRLFYLTWPQIETGMSPSCVNIFIKTSSKWILTNLYRIDAWVTTYRSCLISSFNSSVHFMTHRRNFKLIRLSVMRCQACARVWVRAWVSETKYMQYEWASE